MDNRELTAAIKNLPSVLGWQDHSAKAMVAKDSVLELVRQLDGPEEVGDDPYYHIDRQIC